MKYLFAAILFLSLAATGYAGDISHVQEMIDCSVTVSGLFATGSGTLYKIGDETHVLTCAHTLEGEISGDFYVIAVYQDKEGKKDITFASIVSIDHKKDIAILKTMDPKYGKAFATFYQGPIPKVGTSVYHVGSLFGSDYPNSFTTGVISYNDRFLPEGTGGLYDQTSAIIFSGSSGGSVFLEDGRYLGMVLRQRAPGIGFYRPIRAMQFDGKP